MVGYIIKSACCSWLCRVCIFSVSMKATTGGRGVMLD